MSMRGASKSYRVIVMIPELLDRGNRSDIAIAIDGDGPRVTYDSLRQQIDDAVSQLNAIGLGRGDRIAIALPNGLETIVSFLAAAMAGTAAPLNP
ncbi:MAG TPA: AMP-binding protein, partial [Blastocatellia bacterium]|nr:AMP-binding protein [Blastocatellia bacterium]